ncbi:MAG: nitrilase-related carbon-nitrogen hydrolase [Solirubrobacteraceae bacterium]
MRIALAQCDCSLGEVDANLERMLQLTDQAVSQRADLVVFPELAAHGYWLGQLPHGAAVSALDPRLARLASAGADVLVGFHEDGGVRTYNSAAYLSGGQTLHVHRKLYLPNYLQWEERKHYSPGQSLRAFDTGHGRAAVLICYDAWQAPLPWLAAQDGAELLLIPTNSAADDDSEALHTIDHWCELLPFIARSQQCWVVFVNRVGTEAGTRFWGGSRVLAPDGELLAQAPLWEPALVTVEVDIAAARALRRRVPLLADARLGLIERQLRRLIAEGGDA